MKKFSANLAIFLALAATGLIVVLYSIKSGNFILFAAAILFAAVSTYNIFCNLKG